VDLPKKVSVRAFLDQYRQQCKDVDPEIADEIVAGIKLYFNRTLGTLLLYRLERPQYQRVFHENQGKEMVDVYGCEHLLRLFGTLVWCILTRVSTIAHVDCAHKHGQGLGDFASRTASRCAQVYGSP